MAVDRELVNQLTKRIHRNYPINVLPTVRRNTWSVAPTVDHEIPGLRIVVSATATTDNNKIWEASVEEMASDVAFEGPDSSDPFNYPLYIAWCQWSALIGGTVDSTTSMGLEYRSYGANPPFSLNNRTWVQARQRFNDDQTWDLVVSRGDGTARVTKTGTSPITPAGLASGNRCVLVIDPGNQAVVLYCNHKEVCRVDGMASFPDPNLASAFDPNGCYVGLFVLSGVVSVTASLTGEWSAIDVISDKTGRPGTDFNNLEGPGLP